MANGLLHFGLLERQREITLRITVRAKTNLTNQINQCNSIFLSIRLINQYLMWQHNLIETHNRDWITSGH